MEQQVTIFIDGAPFAAKRGETVYDALVRAGVTIGRCKGNGSCGACGVWIDGDRPVLACRTRIVDGCKIDTVRPLSAPELSTRHGGTVCLDLGSTVMKAAFVIDGKVIDYATRPNPQTAFCPDVLGRAAMQKTIEGVTRDEINRLIGRLTRRADRLVVVGNTVMLHILLGADATGLTAFPYTPAFTAAQKTTGAAIGLNAESVETLPAASAFIGADVTAGVAATVDGGRTELYIDLGTNGESVLMKGGQPYACSAAAGSALGCDASQFIEYVRAKRIAGELPPEGNADTQGLQLAKAAICACVYLLFDRAAVRAEDVEKVYLMGGLQLQEGTAQAIGLIPKGLPQPHYVGNRALSGAIRYAADPTFCRTVEELALRTVTLDVAQEKNFQKLLVRSMPLREI